MPKMSEFPEKRKDAPVQKAWMNREHPLRIVELCLNRALGGLELYMARLSGHLSRRGHRVVPVVEGSGLLAGQSEFTGLPLEAIPLRWVYLDPAGLIRLAGLVRRFRPHIIHLHRAQDLPMAVLARRLGGGGKLVFTLQIESKRKKQDPYHRWLYGQLDALVVVTRRLQHLVQQSLPVSREKIHQIYYGVDRTRFRPNPLLRSVWREHLGIGAGQTVIGLVGRLEPGKGHLIFLEAAAQVSRRLPHLRFVMIGSETAGRTGFRDLLEARVRELGLVKQVRFLDHQQRIHELLPMLDVVVLASRKETFGLALVEAMAAGAAPIGTNAGGVPEIIEHNRNGLLVPPEDAEALARALFKLAGDGGKRRRLARAARRTVEQKFDLDEHLNRLEALFLQLSRGGARGTSG
ncbi:MAG: glycosyltransferase family 1 protein [Calditrichaeota bacterium]|nr:MAG: glycosyltransferase family 1 protein [Calditrichota bacterium]